MKLLLGSPIETECFVENSINESTKTSQKNYYIEGTVATIETPNRNGRIYSRDLWVEQVERYNKDTLLPITKNVFCELEHPPRAEVDEMKAVARIVNLYIKENYVYAKIKILNDNSPETNKLKALIDEGYKIGVSSRGVGDVVEKNGIPYVEKGNYHFITLDIVGMPSDRAANLNGIYESIEKNSKEYKVNPTTNEIEEIELCGIDGTCKKFSQKDVEEQIVKKLQDLFANYTSQNVLDGKQKQKETDTINTVSNMNKVNKVKKPIKPLSQVKNKVKEVINKDVPKRRTK